MSKSIVEASAFEHKMGESLTSVPTLDTSISFGRFENDSLSWEKWSTFSPNKYLEEVEKCSTPGTVAQKKAYFEAHYKNFPARKTDIELDKLTIPISENRNENDSEGSTEKVNLEDSVFTCDDIREDVSERSNEEVENFTTFDVIKEDISEKSVEDLENSSTFDEIKEGLSEKSVQEVESSFTFDEIKDVSERSTEEVEKSSTFDAINEDFSEELKQEVVVSSVITSITFDEIKEDEEIEDEKCEINSREDNLSTRECESSLIEDFKEETSDTQSVNNTKEFKDTEKVMLLEKKHISQKVMKKVSKVDNLTKKLPESGNKKARNIIQKKTPKKEPKLIETKKKIISSTPKSAPQLSRVTPKSSSISTSESSSKKLSGTHLPRNRRAAPSSMHMSLNLGQPNNSTSSSQSSTRRKSLIMEQMADKDIIKRAFKSFQNNYSHDKFSGESQGSSDAPEGKVMPSLTPRKENEGLRKVVDKRTPQRGQVVNKSSSISSGLSSLAAKKNVKAVTPSVSLRSDEKAEKRREFLKKLEQKSIAREVEKAQLSAKSKEEKSDMEKGKQRIYAPVRTSTKGPIKKSSQKEVVKNKVNLQNR